MRPDLLAEFEAAVTGCTDADHDALAALGVSDWTIVRTPLDVIGAAQVRAGSDGLFDFVEEGGRRAWVLPTNLAGSYRAAEIEDLIAIDQRPPHHWRLRLGIAEILGGHEIERRVFGSGRYVHSDLRRGPTDEPLRIWRTPLAWLQAGAEGVCVLQWTVGAVADLSGIWTPLVAEDLAHGREIKARLTEPMPPLPTIMVPEASMGRAA